LEPIEANGDFLAGVLATSAQVLLTVPRECLLHQKPWKFVGCHWIDSFDQRKDPERKVVKDAAAAAA
jgi:hypothetical protein